MVLKFQHGIEILVGQAVLIKLWIKTDKKKIF